MMTGQQGESQEGRNAGSLENEVEITARILVDNLLYSNLLLPFDIFDKALKLRDALNRVDEMRRQCGG